MKREKITPKDKADWLEMRTKDITSTEVSALFGLSPYATEFELWNRKKDGAVPEFTETDRMKWGSRLESAIAHGIAEDNGWQIAPFKDYVRLPELKMGSSFDFLISPKEALLEIKNVDALQFKEKWEIDDDNIEAPPHIEMQLQYQMLVSGVAEGYIAALIGGNQVKLIRREIDDDIAKAIQEKVFNFWESIRRGKAPDPDFKRDHEFITKLHRSSTAGKVLDADSDARILTIAQGYRYAAEQEAQAKEAKAACKAELLTIIGDAEKVLGDGFTISAGTVAPTRVEAYDRAGFRNFRVNFKKEKK
jgi:putative phage-type endonuclease